MSQFGLNQPEGLCAKKIGVLLSIIGQAHAMTDRSPFIVVGIPYSPNRIGALEDWLEKLSLQLREKEREVRAVGLWPSAVAAVAATFCACASPTAAVGHAMPRRLPAGPSASISSRLFAVGCQAVGLYCKRERAVALYADCNRRVCAGRRAACASRGALRCSLPCCRANPKLWAL